MPPHFRSRGALRGRGQQHRFVHSGPQHIRPAFHPQRRDFYPPEPYSLANVRDIKPDDDGSTAVAAAPPRAPFPPGHPPRGGGAHRFPAGQGHHPLYQHPQRGHMRGGGVMRGRVYVMRGRGRGR
ncbi:hypothetical protein JCM8547_000919 [Rhodosporidiobolus lusitaniae]